MNQYNAVNHITKKYLRERYFVHQADSFKIVNKDTYEDHIADIEKNEANYASLVDENFYKKRIVIADSELFLEARILLTSELRLMNLGLVNNVEGSLIKAAGLQIEMEEDSEEKAEIQPIPKRSIVANVPLTVILSDSC